MRFSNFLSKVISILFAAVIFFHAPIVLRAEGGWPEISSGNIEQHFIKANIIQHASIIGVANNESTLTAPVTDPNFNVMRKREDLNTKSIIVVVGLLLLAAIVPYFAWIALSRK